MKLIIALVFLTVFAMPFYQILKAIFDGDDGIMNEMIHDMGIEEYKKTKHYKDKGQFTKRFKNK
jgi:hypothetical protein